jgi:hypothetical protein
MSTRGVCLTETAVTAAGGVARPGRPLRPPVADDVTTSGTGDGLVASGEEQRRVPGGEVEMACSRRPFAAVDGSDGLPGRNGDAQVSTVTRRGLPLMMDHTTQPKGVGGGLPGSGQAAWCLSAAYREKLEAEGPQRPSVHSDGLQASVRRTSPRAPRGRAKGRARELVPERGDGDAGCLFYFICPDSKMQNSLKWQLS